jgi:hypothetical protein
VLSAPCCIDDRRTETGRDKKETPNFPGMARFLLENHRETNPRFL